MMLRWARENEKLMDLEDIQKLQKMAPAERDKAFAALHQQTTILMLQKLFGEINDTCVKKCVTSPGTELTGSQKQCLERCSDRFIEIYQSTARAYQNRLQTQLNAAGNTFNTGAGGSGYSDGYGFS